MRHIAGCERCDNQCEYGCEYGDSLVTNSIDSERSSQDRLRRSEGYLMTSEVLAVAGVGGSTANVLAVSRAR